MKQSYKKTYETIEEKKSLYKASVMSDRCMVPCVWIVSYWYNTEQVAKQSKIQNFYSNVVLYMDKWLKLIYILQNK